MKKRERHRRRHQPVVRHHAQPTLPPPDPEAAARSWERWGWLVSGVAVVALVATVAVRNWPDTPDGEQVAVNKKDGPGVDDKPPHAAKPVKAPAKKSEPGSFLDEFNDKDATPDKENDTPALSSAELEQRFQALVQVNEQIVAIKKQALEPGGLASDKILKKAEADGKRLMEQFDRLAVALEKDVGQARKARPDDAVPRWLAGELLILVGGEPEEIAPHLEFAVKQGLKRTRLLGSLALAQLEANQFKAAYSAAEDALDRAGQDRYVWNAYGRIAFSSNRFDEVRDRLGRAFPDGLPAWAKEIRRNAVELQARWEMEETRRRAEATADDLPRVRLVIEHRRFAKDAAGKPLTSVESTGREEVVLELFENEAPRTVANFVELVEHRFYDGTSFHLAVPAIMVAGGDPKTKYSDPSEHGTGGPGYVIADEFKAPAGRAQPLPRLGQHGQHRAAHRRQSVLLLPVAGTRGQRPLHGFRPDHRRPGGGGQDHSWPNHAPI